MKARVEFTLDWQSRNGDDQKGRVIIHPQDGSNGRVHGSWSCKGGMGQGTDLDENTTTCWTDEQAELIIDRADICREIGTYDCDIE